MFSRICRSRVLFKMFKSNRSGINSCKQVQFHLSPIKQSESLVSDFSALKESEDQFKQDQMYHEEKVEYCDDHVVYMTGTSPNHNRIVGSLFAKLELYTKSHRCTVFGSDLGLKPDENSLFYPDISIYCDPIKWVSERGVKKGKNPTVLIEGLSPSTARIDNDTKFKKYVAVPSLKEYIKISTTDIFVSKFIKKQGEWHLLSYDELDHVLVIDSLKFSITLKELYEQAVYPPLIE